MSYPPPPSPLPPQFTSFNPSTPPPPPPKPPPQRYSVPPVNQQPPALPPHPSHSAVNHSQYENPHGNIQAGFGDPSSQHQELPYRCDAPADAAVAQQYQAQSALPEEGWVPDILLDKSKQDLEALINDPALLQALIHNPSTTHPSLPASLNPLLPLLHSNITLATHILTLLSTAATQRAHTTAQLHSVRALEQQWKKKQAELERKLEPWGPRELHQRLGAAIVEGEAMCRGVEESFLEGRGGDVVGEREVGEWVRRVREGRRVVALRRERKARWDEGRVGGWR